MNAPPLFRFLQWFNLAGVCALAILCAIQWQVNRTCHLRVIDLDRTRLAQSQTLSEKDKTIHGNIADMNDFRARLEKAHQELTDVQTSLKDRDAKIAALTRERDQLQDSVKSLENSLTQWKSAVAARDDALQKAHDQEGKLIADRNDAVSKFNDLAKRYNTAEDQLKQAADEIKKLASDRNEAVQKFNDLANKYNDLAKQLGGGGPSSHN